MVNGLLVRVLDIDCRQSSHLGLGNVQLDSVAETGYGSYGDRHLFATPYVPLLEEDVCHTVGAAVDHEALHQSDLAIGGMDAIALGCLTAILLSNVRLSRKWIIVSGITGAALLVFSLCFSDVAYRYGLGRNGLNMSVLAVGACLVIAAAAQSPWRAPRILAPLTMMGQRSYEIYLTHMFAVLLLFTMFIRLGKPRLAVPALFLAAIIAAGILGWVVAVIYAEPMNRAIRRLSAVDKAHLGAAVPEAD